MPLSYEEFKEQASLLCGIDLSLYKSQQLDRRINSLMNLWQVENYDEYLRILKTDPQRFQVFLKKLTINVSEFFRNPECYFFLWETLIPELLEEQPKIKIWSAGCATGAEPYSVAIILKELKALHRAEILATDVDAAVLKRAREGVYSPNEVKSLPQELLVRYFREEKGFYHLLPEIKTGVNFERHNLLLDPFPTGFDLILCRNVVIYFAEEAKSDLYYKFHRSLRNGGYLMVGGTEPLLGYKQLGFETIRYSFYKKVAAEDL
ncbi:MAG: protein-glutamate O-methyltransferase CheR [Firmicutes bacterium]|nr:protein-glutamate O-methyltransferase CheR [Bacillota bacterium]